MTLFERIEIERIADELHAIRIALANLRSRIALARASVGVKRAGLMESGITSAKSSLKNVEDMSRNALAELGGEA